MSHSAISTERENMMDFSILYAIQAMRSPALDQMMLALTNIMGSIGQVWILVALGLMIFKKTRKAGICVFMSYILVLLVGHVWLKDFIARPRPCHLDESIVLLVERPTSFSCPSTHTAWAFAAATSICLYYKKAGIATFVIAAIMGFSRMYMFVHFPTDVLFGVVLGVVLAILAKVLLDQIDKAKESRS